MTAPEWHPRCAVTTCDRPAETCGYCVPCWVRMDLEGIPDDAPLPDPFPASKWETDAAAARGWGA